MVLWLKPWESRSLPGLPRTMEFLFRCHDQSKTPSPSGGGVFVCAVETRSVRAVHISRVDLGDAIDGDPVALLDRERVLGRLKLERGADAIAAQMDARLQVLGAWVQRNFGRQPAEQWSDMRALWPVDARNELVEPLLAQRDPDAPDQRFVLAMDRNLDTSAHEEMLVVDDAGFRFEDAAARTFPGWNCVENQRCFGEETWHALVPLVASRALEAKPGCLPASRARLCAQADSGVDNPRRPQLDQA